METGDLGTWANAYLSSAFTVKGSVLWGLARPSNSDLPVLVLSVATGQGQSRLPVAPKSGLSSHGDAFCPGRVCVTSHHLARMAAGSPSHTPSGNAAFLPAAPWAELYLFLYF